MKKGVFSIYDVKGRVYGPLMLHTHKGEAIRSFSDIITQQDSMLKRHPEDYKLYKIGNFDLVSGEFASEGKPEFLNNATDFIMLENLTKEENKNIQGE